MIPSGTCGRLEAVPGEFLGLGNGRYQSLTQGEAGGDGAGQGTSRAMVVMWQAGPTPCLVTAVLAIEVVDDLGGLGVGASDQDPAAAAGQDAPGAVLGGLGPAQGLGLGEVRRCQQTAAQEVSAYLIEQGGVDDGLSRS